MTTQFRFLLCCGLVSVVTLNGCGGGEDAPAPKRAARLEAVERSITRSAEFFDDAPTQSEPAMSGEMSSPASEPVAAPSTSTSSEESPTTTSNANETNDAAAAPPAALDGTWRVKSATLFGQPMAPAIADTIVLTLNEGKYEVNLGNDNDKGKFVVDSTVTPNRMTIEGVEGPNAGKTIRVVYESIDADTMRLCYDLSGKEFPTEFSSTPENKWFLVEYVRQK